MIKRQRQQLACGYAEMIVDIYRSLGLTGHDLTDAINHNVFMATMNFTNTTFEERESRSDSYTYLNRYDNWHRRLIFQSFGKNPIRKKRFQPFSMAFVDYSRSDDDKDISLDEFRLRGKLYKHHVHAVIALKPRGQEFRRPLLVAGSAHQDKAFGHVIIEQFNPAKGTLANMIEYCSKGSMSVDNGRAHADMWDTFPIFREKTKTRTSNVPSLKSQLPSASGL